VGRVTGGVVKGNRAPMGAWATAPSSPAWALMARSTSERDTTPAMLWAPWGSVVTTSTRFTPDPTMARAACNHKGCGTERGQEG
jgi:hypothetical protein